MKKNSLFICIILLAASVNSLYGQSAQTTTYYRYFTVECKKINTSDFNLLKADESDSQPISFKNVCAASSKILVAVDASYPKRVKDIKAEIDEMIQSHLPKAKIRTTEAIPVSDKQNFCE